MRLLERVSVRRLLARGFFPFALARELAPSELSTLLSDRYSFSPVSLSLLAGVLEKEDEVLLFLPFLPLEGSCKEVGTGRGASLPSYWLWLSCSVVSIG